MEDLPDAIADDELLYRRVPKSQDWYDPLSKLLKPEAFEPNRTLDVTGLSVSRGKFKSVEDASRGRPGKSYYVAILNAGDLRRSGISVVPRPNTPDGFDPAHAELPDLTSGNRKETATLERQRLLVELCLEVRGPFTTPDC